MSYTNHHDTTQEIARVRQHATDPLRALRATTVLGRELARLRGSGQPLPAFSGDDDPVSALNDAMYHSQLTHQRQEAAWALGQRRGVLAANHLMTRIAEAWTPSPLDVQPDQTSDAERASLVAALGNALDRETLSNLSESERRRLWPLSRQMLTSLTADPSTLENEPSIGFDPDIGCIGAASRGQHA